MPAFLRKCILNASEEVAVRRQRERGRGRGGERGRDARSTSDLTLARVRADTHARTSGLHTARLDGATSTCTHVGRPAYCPVQSKAGDQRAATSLADSRVYLPHCPGLIRPSLAVQPRPRSSTMIDIASSRSTLQQRQCSGAGSQVVPCSFHA